MSLRLLYLIFVRLFPIVVLIGNQIAESALLSWGQFYMAGAAQNS